MNRYYESEPVRPRRSEPRTPRQGAGLVLALLAFALLAASVFFVSTDSTVTPYPGSSQVSCTALTSSPSAEALAREHDDAWVCAFQRSRRLMFAGGSALVGALLAAAAVPMLRTRGDAG